MHRDEVGPCQQIVEAHSFDAEGGRRVRVDVRIVSEDFQSKRLGLGCERARNIAEAYEAERLAFQAPQRHDRRHFPAAGLHQLVGKRHLAGEREQQRHGVVGYFAQAIIRNVIDRDAELLCCGQIDVVDAKAEAADRLAVLQLPQQFARQLGVSHEDRIGVARGGENVVGGGAVRHAVFGIEPRQRVFGRIERGKGLSVMAIRVRGILDSGTSFVSHGCVHPQT